MVDGTWFIAPGYVWVRIEKGTSCGQILRVGSNTNPFRINDWIIFNRDELVDEVDSEPGHGTILVRTDHIGAYKRPETA